MKLGILIVLVVPLAVGWALPAEVSVKAQSAAPAPRAADAAASRAEAVPPPAPAVQPQSKSETLHFNVNWPSGLSLGEGEMTSNLGADGWSLSYHLDAGVPGFAVNESAHSKASTDLCSLEFTKEGTRGKRHVEETSTFDSASLTATRTTANGGGKTETHTSACARDAL